MINKARKEHARLSKIDVNTLSHQEKIDHRVKMIRARNQGKVTDRGGYDTSWGRIWRKLPIYYVMGADNFGSYGPYIRSKGKDKAKMPTALGRLLPDVVNNLA